VTLATTLLLILQGACFILWAAVSFRALFQIRAIAAGRTGQMFPGPMSFLSAMGAWIRDPQHKFARALWLAGFIGILLPSIWLAMQAPITE